MSRFLTQLAKKLVRLVSGQNFCLQDYYSDERVQLPLWKKLLSGLLVFCTLLLCQVTLGQTTPSSCVQGCTSNDVQIVNAYLSNASGVKLGSDFVCPLTGKATVYLTLELTTNTPRVGVSIYSLIKALGSNGQPTGDPIATMAECFGTTLNQPTNKVTFQQPFEWQCGTAIALTDVFIAWGTGNKNFCTGSGFQCPATPSKCYQLPGGTFIAIETPTPQNNSATQCSDAKGGTTSTFNLNNITVTSSTNVTITWWEGYTAPSTFTGQILTPSAYSTASRTVYAKITSNTNSSVFSVATVTLTVNQTPKLVINAPTAVCSPNTVDITASVDASSILPTGTTLKYYTDNNGVPGSEITSAQAQAVGNGVYWITANSNTTPSCADTKSVTATVKTTPAAPVLSKADNCDGTTTISAKDGQGNLISSSELTWSNGATGNPISVTSNTAITATRTVNSCTSGSSNSITPAPKTTPAAPVLSKADNCDGTTTISAKDGQGNLISSSELTWSNGATGNPISVTSTTAITATRTVNGCTSASSNSITPAPKTTPAAPGVSITEATLCGELNAPKLTVTNPIPGAIYTLTQASGGTSFSPVAYQSGTLEFTGLVPGKGFSISVSKDGCVSGQANCLSLSADNTAARINSSNITTIEADLTASQQSTVIAAPNPFSDKIRFSLKSAVSGKGTLELYNMLGQKIKTVYQGQVNAGQVQTVEYNVPGNQRANLIYVFIVGDQRTSGKLIGLK